MIIAQQIGRYHLLDRIAIGGMAEIYRAITFDSRGHEHMVAIKRVLNHLADDEDFLQMLVDEAKIAILLDHPNIAKVYEFARIGDDYFIAMEYVDGKDVRSIMERLRRTDGWLPPEHAAQLMMQILMGLHVTHDQCDGAGTHLKIVHRDISPSNLLVSFTGDVKLCDFGIAKARLSRIQTRAGVIKGKVKYMSPEQAMGHKLDRRSDIFSAGSVLYELLTRQPPFSADDETELIFKVRDAHYTPPARLNPELPGELEQVIQRALNRSLSARYQTAQEFADDLAAYLTRHHPEASPARLGRYLCQMFAEEIEQDLRLLEEFVVGAVDPEAVGDNLLAEVLGEGAAYTRFSPVLPDEQGPGQSNRTRLIPRVPPPEQRLPQEADLHGMKTQIIDLQQRDRLVRLRRKRTRPGVDYVRDKRRDTEQSTAPVALDQTPTDPRPAVPDEDQLDSDFHRLPTKIIRVTDDEP